MKKQTLTTRFLALLFCLVVVKPSHARTVPPDFITCRTLDACLRALDSAAHDADGSQGPSERAYTRKLSTFGNPAKHELLRRAAGSDPKWRELAQVILVDWNTWSQSDVPELRAALRAEPGGWMPRALFQIGTPEAIEAIIEDLPNDDDNQAQFWAEKLGVKVLPYLMPLLEDDAKANSALKVIRSIRNSVAPVQTSWVRTAIDPSQTLLHRIAALRAISALGVKGRPSASAMKTLSSCANTLLRDEATLTLEAIESFEPSISPNVQEVSMLQLLGSPQRFDGKRVRVIGFLSLEFEGTALYLHQEDFDHVLSKNAIAIDAPRDLSPKQKHEVDSRYALCEGIFRAKQRGHMGSFSAALTNITRLDLWPVERPKDPTCTIGPICWKDQ